MAVYDIEKFIGRRDGDRAPVHDWKWVCTSLPFGMDADYCEQVSIPLPSFAQKPLFGAGTFSFYAGFQEVNAFDCEFYEDTSMRTSSWLDMWRTMIRDPETGAFSLPTVYKHDWTFARLNDQNATILTVVAKNCWPTTIGPWALNYTGGNGLLKVQQNFSTDGLELFK